MRLHSILLTFLALSITYSDGARRYMNCPTSPQTLRARLSPQNEDFFNANEFERISMPYTPSGFEEEHDPNAHITYKKVDGCFCEDKADNFAGYYHLPSKQQKLFFWFFLSRNQPTNSPVLGWFNGGPGCSSILGLYTENGPCLFDESQDKVYWNPYGWNDRANIFFIDQPPGTGWSRGPSDSNSDQVGRQVTHLFRAMAESQSFGKYFNNDLYLFGESYAGHYLPSMSHEIWRTNKLPSVKTKLKLKGVGCGNGMTDPADQYGWYAHMALNSGTTCPRIDKTVFDEMQKLLPNCQAKAKVCGRTSQPESCKVARAACSPILEKPLEIGYPHWNQYDFRRRCAAGTSLCYSVFDHVNKLMNKDTTKAQLGVKGSWSPCSWAVNGNFNADWMRNFGGKYWSDLLKDGIKVMLYAGDQDYICNWMGNKDYILKLPWPGKEKFNEAKDMKWIVDGVWAGKIRQYGPLTFLQVFDAGHMVPLDQPKHALAMLNSFMDNTLKPPSQNPQRSSYREMQGNKCRKGYDNEYQVPLQLQNQQQQHEQHTDNENLFAHEQEIGNDDNSMFSSQPLSDLTKSLAQVFQETETDPQDNQK